MSNMEQQFKIVEVQLSDRSYVYDVVLSQDEDIIKVYCTDEQHANRVAAELKLAGFSQVA